MLVYKWFFVSAFLFVLKGGYGQVDWFRDFDYSKADSVAEYFDVPIDISAKELAFNLVSDFDTDQEKFRVLFKWICENIEYKKGKYGKNPDDIVRKRVAVCEGYASLLKEFCNVANIECVYISGYSKVNPYRDIPMDISKTNHAWNAVSLNGEWYLTDVTWAAGYLNRKSKRFVKCFNELYFIARPEIFMLRHFPKDRNWILTDEILSLKAYSNAAIVYSKVEKYGVLNMVPPDGKIRRKIDFYFYSGQDVKNVRIIFRNKKGIEIIPQCERKGDYYHYTAKLRGRYSGPVDVYIESDRILTFLKL